MENFKLIMQQEQVARILQLLAEHPYKQVGDLIDSIKNQVGQQMQEARMAQQGIQQGNGVADTTATPGSTVQ